MAMAWCRTMTDDGVLVSRCGWGARQLRSSHSDWHEVCSATYIGWQRGTTAFARRCCSNRSIASFRRAHSSKPTAAGLLLWARAGTDGRTPYKPYHFIVPVLHTVRAVSSMLAFDDHSWLKGKGIAGQAHSRLPILGSQPAGDVSHKPGGRLPLLSARPAVTPATLKRAPTNFAAWWTDAQCVWTVCLRLLPDSIATAIWTQALLRLSRAR